MQIDELITLINDLKDEGIEEIEIINTNETINNRILDCKLEENSLKKQTKITINVTESNKLVPNRLKIVTDYLKRYNNSLSIKK